MLYKKMAEARNDAYSTAFIRKVNQKGESQNGRYKLAIENNMLFKVNLNKR